MASVIEERGDDEDWTIDVAKKDNARMLERCMRYGVEYIFIDEEYRVDIEL